MTAVAEPVGSTATVVSSADVDAMEAMLDAADESAVLSSPVAGAPPAARLAADTTTAADVPADEASPPVALFGRFAENRLRADASSPASHHAPASNPESLRRPDFPARRDRAEHSTSGGGTAAPGTAATAADTASQANAGPIPRRDSVQTLLSLIQSDGDGNDGQGGSGAEGGDSSGPCVRGIDGAGKPHITRVTPELEHITLSGLGLHSMSLLALQLHGAPQLRELTLAANALSAIDLAPLSAPPFGCPELTVLALNSNRLRAVDLEPLRGCPKLERVWLHDNALQTIDLSPLSACPNLRSLYLEDNAIHDETLDLTPLANAKQLKSLRLSGNLFGARLDVTALLNVPALSQLHVAPDVQMYARGSSKQARVSPAMRRCVLDIMFEAPSAPSSSSSSSPASSPTMVTSANRPERKSPVQVQKSSTSSVQPQCSSSPSPTASTSTDAESRSPTRPSAVVPTDSADSGSGSRPEPSSPDPIDLGQSASPQTPASGTDAASPTKRRQRSSILVESLLIGFRRLLRYATEDALSRCGMISIRSVEPDVALADPACVLASHVVLLQTPTPTLLEQIALITKSVQVPVVVIGTERYRSANEAALEGLTFLHDPVSVDSMRSVYENALATAEARSSGPTVPHGRRTAGPRRASAAASSRGAARASPSGKDVDAANEDASAQREGKCARDASSVHGAAADLKPSLRLSPALHGANGPGKTEGGPCSPRFGRPPRSAPPTGACAQSLSRSLSMPLNMSSFGRLQPSSSTTSLPSPDMMEEQASTFETGKMRAERAAIDIAFHDAGGHMPLNRFPQLARTCGMPKCAGALLFQAVVAGSTVIESTSPEPGVVGGSSHHAEEGNGSPFASHSTTSRVTVAGILDRKVSLSAFVAYWEARLGPYDGDARLAHVILDSRSVSAILRAVGTSADDHVTASEHMHGPMQNVSSDHSKQAGDKMGATHPHGIKKSPSRSFREIVQTYLQSSELRGYDSGVEELISGFMQGRSNRFGMFALVKLHEAIAIGTSLVLLALRGKCRSRVGGRARTIGPRELRVGKLNASLIAAEAGIFEGVSTDLSTDRLRTIKGNYSAEARPEAVVASDGCALSYTLSEEEVKHYNMQRRFLLRRGVQAVLSVHCRGRKHMNLAEFAVLHTNAVDLTSNAAADYFFSVIDYDQDDVWSIADLQHFHSEKARTLRTDNLVLSELHQVWECLWDMMRPAGEVASTGITRADFMKLSPRRRKAVLQSVLYREDDQATLNIRKTVALEGGNDVAPLVGMS